MSKYKVNLSSTEREDLTALIQSGVSTHTLTHARILLIADSSNGQGHTDDYIASALGVSTRTVSRVRRRLVSEGISSAVNRRPQPARSEKLKIQGDLEERLIQLASSELPPGYRSWPMEVLACELGVSTETVRRALLRRSGTFDRRCRRG
jgi:DNA-binding transcriptional regulator YhcF (GntR family)